MHGCRRAPRTPRRSFCFPLGPSPSHACGRRVVREVCREVVAQRPQAPEEAWTPVTAMRLHGRRGRIYLCPRGHGGDRARGPRPPRPRPWCWEEALGPRGGACWVQFSSSPLPTKTNPFLQMEASSTSLIKAGTTQSSWGRGLRTPAPHCPLPPSGWRTPRSYRVLGSVPPPPASTERAGGPGGVCTAVSVGSPP